MSVAGLQWGTKTMLFVGGLAQRSDPRALDLPELVTCKDVQFDRIGGIQTRYPYAAVGSNILGGGTISNARRLVRNGDELLLFTKDTLYSWSAQLSKWVSKGTHLAIKLTEQSKFVNTVDQIEGDRAELSSAVVFAWSENGSTYAAAIDKNTGGVIVAPTLVSVAARPRLVALSTKILLFTLVNGGALEVRAIDPTDIATGLASAATTVVAAGSVPLNYDATRVLGADSAVFASRRSVTTSYDVGTVTAGLVVTASAKARVCDGPIAVSSTPDGASVQVVRANTTNIQGDLITIATLADVYTGQAVGTAGGLSVNQIAAAHRSTQDAGQYRCYAFWSYQEAADSTGLSFGTKSNWVDTGNNLGSQADFVDHTGVASRAFDHEGRIFVWITFALASLTTQAGGNTPQIFGSLQNTYFLYRDDAFLCAKSTPLVGGGYSPSTGHLSGVANIGGSQYAWCGLERRRLELGGNLQAYSDRAPREVIVEFDSNEARRCARLGETLYITGGEILQYDGTRITEVGFHIFPWQMDLTDLAAGAVADGTYAYQMTWRWDNARGERERSASATAGELVLAGGGSKPSIAPWCNLNITHKTASAPAAEVWRTAVNPTDQSPFYLVTSPDPTILAGDNRYIPTDATAMALTALNDNFADATLLVKEAHPENGGKLKSFSPPAASLILATDTRVFLAGIAGDPHRVVYSKYRDANQVAAFFGTLAVDIPQEGGDIVGLALLNERCVVFRETAIYVLDGEGFDNTGGQSNYVARRIPGTVGAVSQEAISNATERGIAFKSSKGWHVLTPGWTVDYIGAPIVDYDTDTVYAVHAMEQQHQVRVLTSSRMLVLDTYASEVLGRPMWSEWTISDGLHATVHGGVHYYLTTTGPKSQQSTYTGVDYGIDIETAPLKFEDIQGYGALDFFDVLGEFRSNCTVRVRLAQDYSSSYFQDKTHTPSLSVGAPYQLRHRPSRRQMKSLRVRLTVTQTAAGESVKLTGIAFRLGVIPGLNRNIAVANKQ